MANRISVKIGGMNYSLLADESEEYVAALAERLDRQYPKESGIPHGTAAILAGIAVADELTKLEDKTKEVFAQLREYEAETVRLRAEVAALKRENLHLRVMNGEAVEKHD